MELCRSSLDEFISVCHCKKQDLPWGFRLKFFNEIVDALAYLHCDNPEKSFIHGDIKPKNILLTDDLTVKLADFGSTEIKKVLSLTLMSKPFEVNQQHTPFYTAPEFLKDPSQKTSSMDIYR